MADGRGYDVRSADAKQAPSAYFMLMALKNNTLNFSIGQDRPKPDSIGIVGLVDTAKVQTAFSRLPDQQKDDFIAEMNFSVATLGVDLTLNPPNTAKGHLAQHIIVSKTLWYDGITKNNLMQAVGNVLWAVQVVRLLSYRRLRAEPTTATQPIKPSYRG